MFAPWRNATLGRVVSTVFERTGFLSCPKVNTLLWVAPALEDLCSRALVSPPRVVPRFEPVSMLSFREGEPYQLPSCFKDIKFYDRGGHTSRGVPHIMQSHSPVRKNRTTSWRGSWPEAATQQCCGSRCWSTRWGVQIKRSKENINNVRVSAWLEVRDVDGTIIVATWKIPAEWASLAAVVFAWTSSGISRDHSNRRREASLPLDMICEWSNRDSNAAKRRTARVGGLPASQQQLENIDQTIFWTWMNEFWRETIESLATAARLEVHAASLLFPARRGFVCVNQILKWVWCCWYLKREASLANPAGCKQLNFDDVAKYVQCMCCKLWWFTGSRLGGD